MWKKNKWRHVQLSQNICISEAPTQGSHCVWKTEQTGKKNMVREKFLSPKVVELFSQRNLISNKIT